MRWSIEPANAVGKQMGPQPDQERRRAHRHGRGLVRPAGHHPDDALGRRLAQPWYQTKTQPSFEDMITKLRKTLIVARFTPASTGQPARLSGGDDGDRGGSSDHRRQRRLRVGRHLGSPLVARRMVRRRRERLDRAREFPTRPGGAAVFPGGQVRGVLPGGHASPWPVPRGMRYRRSLAVNAAGGIVWNPTGVVLLGYLAGTSYAAVERTAGGCVALAVTGVVIVALWCGGSGPIGRSAAAVGRL